MKRRLFNLLAGVSLLLLVTTLAIWIGSILHNPLIIDRATITQDAHLRFRMFTYHGRNQIDWTSGSRLGIHEMPQLNLRVRYFDWSQVGLSGVYNPRVKDPDHYKGRYLAINFPSWILALLTTIAPVIWIARRRQKPLDGNLCLACGYDLCATPDRCPECGMIPK